MGGAGEGRQGRPSHRRAPGRLHEAQADHHTRVLGAPPAAEHAPPEELLEDLVDVLGPATPPVLEPEWPAAEVEAPREAPRAPPEPPPEGPPRAGAAALLHALHVLAPHLVVYPPLLRVLQGLVRLPHLGELPVGPLGVILVGVWMVLLREPVVRLLYVAVRGAPGHPCGRNGGGVGGERGTGSGRGPPGCGPPEGQRTGGAGAGAGGRGLTEHVVVVAPVERRGRRVEASKQPATGPRRQGRGSSCMGEASPAPPRLVEGTSCSSRRLRRDVGQAGSRRLSAQVGTRSSKFPMKLKA